MKRGLNLPKAQTELQAIHNKAVFDAFNEALDFFRPFGIKGYPCPWMTNFSDIPPLLPTETLFTSMIEKTLQRVLEWSSLMCGFIFEKEDMFMLDNGFMDEEQINLIREERMASVLTSEVNYSH